MGGWLHCSSTGNHQLVYSFDAKRVVLRDVPSAAIGIPLVAIPIFLTLASVVFYVFWGLAVRGRRQ